MHPPIPGLREFAEVTMVNNCAPAAQAVDLRL
jgi:hypothetical protein